MRHVCLPAATLVAASFLTLPVIFGQGAPALSITNYQLVSEQIYTRTQSYYTYRADLLNTGQARDAVTATLTSLAATTVVVPGQGTLHFGPVAAAGRVTSIDTFTILVDRTATFDIAKLQWSFSAPVANAGPNRTATIGATVTLNGSASSNPSGIGTLTYSWAFTSRPPTSAAALTGATTVAPTFVVDVAGSYVCRLTVSNGAGSDSASVTVSTVNSPPVANPGANRTVVLGSTVTLNGSLSSDVDGDPLTYAWMLVSRPSGSTAALTGANTISPSFVADKAGSYVAQLTVNDGKVDSAPVTMTATTQNTPPVAVAGAGGFVNVNAFVQLNGAGSTDVDGDPLTYRWSFNSRPAGSVAVLSNTGIVNPSFTVDVAGAFVVQLIVNDGKVDSAASTVTFTTNAVQAPTANAGLNQTVAHGTTVALHGTYSDAQGLPVTWLWSLTTRPAGSTAVLSSATNQNPTFPADRPGTYVAQLIVNNGYLNSAPSTVSITTTNTAPVANAGSAQTVAVGSTVTLDGSGSADADHDALSYLWSFTSRPTGSTAALVGATAVSPYFVADLGGTYVVQLIVSDGFTSSTPTTVSITATVPTPIGLAPNPLNVFMGINGLLTVSLTAPAGAGGQIVNLSGFNPSVLTGPASVKVDQGSMGANVTLTPVGPGTITLIAAASGFLAGSATVNVIAPSITVTLNEASVGVTKEISGTVTLSVPNPGTGAVVVLSASPGGIVTLQPASVTIAAGSNSGPFTVTGVAAGNATITASSLNYISGTANVSANTIGAITLPSGVSVSPGQTMPLQVSLVTPAPLGGVTITLSSSDSSKVSVTASTFIAQYKTTPDTPPQITGGNVGSATISASAPGFTGDSKTVQVGATMSFNRQLLTIGASGALTLQLTAPALAPSGGLAITLSSDNTATATVPLNLTIPQFTNSVSVPITGVAPGSTVIRASAAGIPETTATITVTPILTILTTSLNNGQVGSSYSQTLSATGGALPYTWSLTGAALPAGLSLNPATGEISGTPTATAANLSLGFRVTDFSGAVQTANTTLSLTIGSGSPASITPLSGTPQSAAISTAFSTPLKATVRDGSGNPVSGASVTFAAPTGAVASGSFASSATVNTDASGVATAPAFTANGTAGTYNVTATVTGVATPATFALTNTAASPSSIVVQSGSSQSAPVTTAFSLPLKAIVKDAGGNPVSGASVTFAAPGSGASGSFASAASVTTDASGVATSPSFTANGTVGAYIVTATVSGVATAASFDLTNVAGPPASIAVQSGSLQSAPISTAFGLPLKAIVKDGSGNPVSGASVTFAAPGTGPSGAFAASATVSTDASGVATSPAFTANATTGNYNVTATVAGVATAANFDLTNTAGAPASIAVQSGNSQSAPISTPFGLPLKAIVKDGSGNPVSGASVTFAAPGTGPSGAFAATATVSTDASGVATSPAFTANATTGNYNVTATVAGVATPATFALTNTAGAPASITVQSGNSQSAPISTAFVLPLKAIVKDSGGNPVSGASVTFAAPGAGASGSFASAAPVTTDAGGVATSSAFTANGTPGAYIVTATVSGVATAANFDLTNLAGSPASIAVQSGTPQSAPIGTAFGAPLKAIVKDSASNPVSGASVTFAAPGAGASGSFASAATVTTDASGVATAPAFTANGTAGGYTVTASVAGVANPANFVLTNTAAAAASVAVHAGSSQSAVIGAAFAAQLQAIVKDASNNPVSGVNVTFTAPSAGARGAFAGGNTVTIATNASGIAASGVFTAGTVAGSYAVTASVTGVTPSASFALTNLVGAAASIVANSGSGQSAVVGTPFTLALQAAVTDAGGNAIAGATVTFTAPSSGAGGLFGGSSSTAVPTNAAGVASAAISANAAAGNYAVTATVAGLGAAASFSLTNVPAGLGLLGVSAASTLLGRNLQTSVTVTLSPAAPAGGTSVTLTSSNAAQAIVNGRSDTSGAMSVTVPVDEGQSSITFWVQGVAQSGPVTLTASASNYVSGTQVLTLTPSGFVIAGPNGPGGSFSTYQGLSTTLTVSPARLDASGNVAGYQEVRGGPQVDILVTNSVPTLGGVAPTTVSFVGGQFSASTEFTATTAFSGATTNVWIGTPNGFSAANAYSVGITVLQSSVIPCNPTVGYKLQEICYLTQSGVTSTDTLYTLTTSDASKMLLSRTRTGAGSSSIVVKVPAFATYGENFYVQALGSGGPPVSYSISGTSTTGTVTLAPSGFVLGTPDIGANFSTFVGGGVKNIEVHSYALSGTTPLYEQAVAGSAVSVSVTSSNTGFGTISTSPVTIAAGSSSALTLFQPVAAGSTVLTATGPAGGGFTTAQGGSLTATILGSVMTVDTGLEVGKNLQMAASLSLGAGAPQGGLPVVLTSNSPNLMLAETPTGPSLSSITVTVPSGYFMGTYYLRAVGTFVPSATSTYTATANGYAPKTGTVYLMPSGVRVRGPNGFSSFIPDTAYYPAAMAVRVSTAYLSTDGNYYLQPLAGTSSLQVSLTNSNSLAGSLPLTATIPGGSQEATVQFTPVTPWQSTTIGVQQPSNEYTAPSSGTSVQVNVVDYN